MALEMVNKTEYLNDKMETQVVIAKMDEKLNNVQKDIHDIKIIIKEFLDNTENKFAKRSEVESINDKVNYVITTLVAMLITSVGFLIKVVFDTFK